MTNLQKQIEELEEVANDSTVIINKKYIKNDVAVNLCKDMARQALSIIKQLQHELSCWQHTHEESKEWIRQLQEEIKQLKGENNDK